MTGKRLIQALRAKANKIGIDAQSNDNLIVTFNKYLAESGQTDLSNDQKYQILKALSERVFQDLFPN